METVIYVHATRRQVVSALQRLPKLIRGNSPIARETLTNIGEAALARIKQAFILKARGGTDEAGEKWKPLAPSTVARKLRRGILVKGLGKSSWKQKLRTTLSDTQRKQWWDVYYRQLIVRHDKKHAAMVAWRIVGKNTNFRVNKYQHLVVPILRETNELLRSLTPGSKNSRQIFRVTPGVVIIGTNRKAAIYHHRGVPGRLPRRRLWPQFRKWPRSWRMSLLAELRQGIIDLAVQIIKEMK